MEKLSLRKKGVGSEARAEQMARSDVDLLLLNETEQKRHRNKQKKRRLQGREEEVLFFEYAVIVFNHLNLEFRSVILSIGIVSAIFPIPIPVSNN